MNFFCWPVTVSGNSEIQKEHERAQEVHFIAGNSMQQSFLTVAMVNRKAQALWFYILDYIPSLLDW